MILERLPKMLFKVFLFLVFFELCLRLGPGAYLFLQNLQSMVVMHA